MATRSVSLDEYQGSADAQELEVLLTPFELAARWGVTEKSLSNQRHLGKGPRYLKATRRDRYPLSAIREYEAARMSETDRA